MHRSAPTLLGHSNRAACTGVARAGLYPGQEGARWGLAGASGGLPGTRALREFTGTRAPRPWRSSGCWVADVLMEMRPKRPGGWPAAVRLEARVLVLRAVLAPQCRASGPSPPPSLCGRRLLALEPLGAGAPTEAPRRTERDEAEDRGAREQGRGPQGWPSQARSEGRGRQAARGVSQLCGQPR